MEVRGKQLCLGCMRQMDKNEACSYCGLVQKDYHPNPRCLMPGTVLMNRYMLGKVLGEGSFGITYIGWDMVLSIPVAVKEYFPTSYVSRDVLCSSDMHIYVYEKKNAVDYKKQLRGFYKEAQLLSRFRNLDSIVSVRDFFYANGTAYIIMEYIEGMSLKEYIKREGHLSGEQTLSLLKPVLLDMDKIHKMGIIHRDISPDNLILNEEGKLIVIDFGSARMKNMDWTKTITVMFKRGFSPEEQYHSKGKQGAYTDIYALCAVMYYMLTGIVPEESVSRMIRDKLMPLTSMKHIHLTYEQKSAIMKGMSVNIKARFQDLEGLYVALFSQGQSKVITGKHKRSIAIILFLVIISGVLLERSLDSGDLLAKKGEKNQGQNFATATSDMSIVSAIKVVSTDSSTFATATTNEELHMMDLTGIEKSKVADRLKQLTGVSFLVEWEFEESEEKKKGIVTGQSLAAGEVLTVGSQYLLILYVGSGKNSTNVTTTTEKKSIQDYNGKRGNTSQSKQKQQEDVEFDGSIK